MTLQSASRLLSSVVPDILKRWEAQVREEVPAARIQERLYLYDALPDYLAHLADLLGSSNWQARLSVFQEDAAEHGRQRAALEGYTLDQVIQEYQILREVLIDFFELHEGAQPSVRRVIRQFLDLGVRNAVFEFDQVYKHKSSNLKIAEERFQTAVEVSKTGFYDWNIVSDYVTFNSQMCKDWQFSAGATLQQVLMLIHPEDRVRVQRQISATMYDCAAYVTEYRVIRPEDQKQIWIHAEGKVTYNSEGEPVRFFGTSMNITDRKEIEQKLQVERRNLDSIFEYSPALMALWRGRDLIYERVNTQYQRLFGERQLVGKSLTDALPEMKGQVFPDMLRKVFDTGDPFTISESSVFLAKGESSIPSEHFFNFTFVRITNEDGSPYGIFNHAVEVTSLVSARKAVENSEARVQQIANAMPEIVWTARSDGFIDWYNDRWYEFTGKSTGSQWNDDCFTLHPEDREKVTERWNESLRTGCNYEMEMRFRCAATGEYRWQISRGIPIKDPDGKVVKWIGTNSDIHDQKMLQNQLEEQREVRERFVTTLSHDLRTPMTAAKMTAQLMKRKSNQPESVETMADRIVSCVDRADRMIRDLLDANRIKAGELLPLNLEECRLDQVSESVVYELSEIHGPRFILDNKIGTIIGVWDCAGIQRILENLCGNAVKYGELERPITITLNEAKECVEISVHNFGDPIALKDQNNLFHPFQRTDSALLGKEKGWGIGLALVRGIAEAHRGSVSVTSNQEEGTTFTVKIPMRV